MSGYRERVRATVEADLARIGNQTIEPPSARPEVHEVELPVSRYERPAEREPEPAPASARMFEAGPAESEPESRLAQPSYAETSRPSESQWPPPADTSSSSAEASSRTPSSSVAAPPRDEFVAPVAAAPVAAASAPWLADADAPADTGNADAPAPWDHLTAEHQPFPIEADAAVAIEANAVDGGDELDDDAFFASLREAVRDEAPLGPRRRGEPVLRRRPGRGAPRALPSPVASAPGSIVVS